MFPYDPKSGLNKFGFTAKKWDATKAEIRAILVARAKGRSQIVYSDLVAELQTAQLEAFDVRLFALLGEIATEEEIAGRRLLSVIVVHKTGDQEPGKGFFELAKYFNRKIKDHTIFWATEMKAVHDYWTKHPHDP
jgi:hypothetical protein